MSRRNQGSTPIGHSSITGRAHGASTSAPESRAMTAVAPAPHRLPAPVPDTEAAGPVLDVVVPVFNEEVDLGPCVRRLHAHLATHPYSFRITVADNASVDGTLAVARGLAAELDGVEVVHLEAQAVDRHDLDPVQAHRIGSVRRPCAEHAELGVGGVVAGPGRQHVTPRPIEPGEHEDLHAGFEVADRGAHLLAEDEGGGR